MEVVQERCRGLDIHKKLIVACANTPGGGGQPRKQMRTFGTMTDELQQLVVGCRSRVSPMSRWKAWVVIGSQSCATRRCSTVRG